MIFDVPHDEDGFQSTLPARGATTDGDAQAPPRKISIHAPRTGSDITSSRSDGASAISIHAPRTGSDGDWIAAHPTKDLFQSTLPARGATAVVAMSRSFPAPISIHAPRTGSDSHLYGDLLRFWHFNPRSPHGERHCRGGNKCVPRRDFNPRSPHGERLGLFHGLPLSADISIHAPRTGSDTASTAGTRTAKKFQSTLPARGATTRWMLKRANRDISIHAPRTGSDLIPALHSARPEISIHAPRTGSDHRPACEICGATHFNPRSPHGERPEASRQ